MTQKIPIGRFRALTSNYKRLRIAVVGDFCLDRYLEVDPARAGISIETGLRVHNVVRVRSQPGGAGTILNNLAALGVGEIFPIGFAGKDGEGFELRRALAGVPGVRMDSFITTPERRTFTYTKPLIISPPQPPKELNRLDFLNWTPTPASLQKRLEETLRGLAPELDAIIILDEADARETGEITRSLLKAVAAIKNKRPSLLIMADSRQRLGEFPPVCFKMNRAELSKLAASVKLIPIRDVAKAASALAGKKGNCCFVTMADHGIVSAEPGGSVEQAPALPVRGEIDVVGAGDCVTANLTAALASGATLREALQIANAAASIVLHKLGTTGTASIREIRRLWQVTPEAGAAR